MAVCASVSMRLSQYKPRKSSSSQEERRKQLLEEQKRLRNDAFNEGRNIDELQCSLVKHVVERNKFYSKKLMHSEWLHDLPSDFEEKWVMIPCPVGNRILVLAGRGITIAFAKDGTIRSRFRSLLPGGHMNSGEPSKGVTLLDCIWSRTNKSYYILDVLAWNNHQLANCDAEFRFYWLKAKLAEVVDISEVAKNNAYSFNLLPSFSCDRGTLDTIFNSYPLVPGVQIDGFLFYHLQAHYIAGSTPLVGWLKPFMVPDFFSLNVSVELLADKPGDYIDFKKYICEYEESELMKRKARKSKKNQRKLAKQMEICEVGGVEGVNMECNVNSEDSSEIIVEHTVEDLEPFMGEHLG